MTPLDVLKTISRGSNVTIPITEEKQRLSGWKVPNSTLQVKIEVVLSSHRQTSLWCVQSNNGENLLVENES